MIGLGKDYNKHQTVKKIDKSYIKITYARYEEQIKSYRSVEHKLQGEDAFKINK